MPKATGPSPRTPEKGLLSPLPTLRPDLDNVFSFSVEKLIVADRRLHPPTTACTILSYSSVHAARYLRRFFPIFSYERSPIRSDAHRHPDAPVAPAAFDSCVPSSNGCKRSALCQSGTGRTRPAPPARLAGTSGFHGFRPRALAPTAPSQTVPNGEPSHPRRGGNQTGSNGAHCANGGQKGYARLPPATLLTLRASSAALCKRWPRGCLRFTTRAIFVARASPGVSPPPWRSGSG